MIPPLPKSVRILGSRARVRTTPSGVALVADGDHRDILGSTNMDTHTIWMRSVDDSQDLVTQQQTLLHEVIHAIIQEAGLKVLFDNSDEREEPVVNALANHLLAILKENRRLVQYLLGRYWL